MLGLALEGGGAKGAFHMGVVKAFLEEGYMFDGVTGTSIGALNGAIIAQGDFEPGYGWWERMDTSMLFDIERSFMQKFMNKKIDKESLLYLYSKLKDIIENRGLDTAKIRETLRTLIDEEKLRKSKVDFGMVTVSLFDFKPVELFKEDIPPGKLVSYLMASANLPIFKIEPLEGKYYIDGGFYDNCPVNLLIKRGYTEVIAVRTLAIGRVRKVKDENVKVTSIIPSDDLGRMLNFDNNMIQNNLKMGYCDAMRTIKGLKGSKYYIEPSCDHDLFFNSLLSIPEESISEAGKIMGLPQMEPKRMLFEKILPAIAAVLDLPINSTYKDIIIGVLESMAEERNIDRLKIRKFGSFLEEIKASGVKEKNISGSFTLKLAERAKQNLMSSKTALLKKVGDELLKVLKVGRFK